MQASTDFLTGLLNRMSCERDLAKFIDEATNNGTLGSVLYIDLDDFKNINDGLGHQCGDILLKAISNSLLKIEEIDRQCYRMGGDEFIVILPEMEERNVNNLIQNMNIVMKEKNKKIYKEGYAKLEKRRKELRKKK